MESLLADAGVAGTAPPTGALTPVATAVAIGTDPDVIGELVEGEVILYADPASLLDSPFQPRTVYNEAKLREGAETMMPPHGRMHQPIVVRDVSDAARPLFVGVDTLATYELVFGHRRKRMALLAGLRRVPIIVRRMTDEQVKYAQLVENMLREDVGPYDEAEAFQRLITEHSETPETIAMRLGGLERKSFVYARLTLLKACPDVRKAVTDGTLGSEIATMVARVGPELLQQKALKALKEQNVNTAEAVVTTATGRDGSMSLRDARELLARMFTITLDKAKFDVGDTTLVPSAGACRICPKLSGNDPAFLDLTRTRKSRHWEERGCDTLCTDVTCWDAKTAAHLGRLADVEREKGRIVIDGNKAKQAVKGDGKSLKGNAFIPIADANKLLKKLPSVRPADGRTAIQAATVLVQDPFTSKLIEAVDVSALKKAGVTLPKAEKPLPYWQAYEADRKKKDAEAKVKGDNATAYNLTILTRVRAAAATRERDMADVDLVARALLATVNDRQQQALMAELWGRPSFEQLVKDVSTISGADLAALMFDAVITRRVHANGHNLDDKPDALIATAKRYKVSLAPTEPAPTPPPAALAPADSRANEADASDEADLLAADADEEAATPASTPKPAARALAGKQLAKYRKESTGETWSGRGLQPKWLKVALADGAKLSDFEVKSQAASGRKDDKGAGSAGVSSPSTPAVAGGDSAKAKKKGGK